VEWYFFGDDFIIFEFKVKEILTFEEKILY
jgi:hypothetical protein